MRFVLMAMNKITQDIAYFLSFCIEKYKEQKHITGAEATKCFAKYGVLDYLTDNFEVLHTQSAQWILEDINEFIDLHKNDKLC